MCTVLQQLATLPSSLPPLLGGRSVLRPTRIRVRGGLEPNLAPNLPAIQLIGSIEIYKLSIEIYKLLICMVGARGLRTSDPLIKSQLLRLRGVEDRRAPYSAGESRTVLPKRGAFQEGGLPVGPMPRSAGLGLARVAAETPVAERGTWFDTCPGRGAKSQKGRII